MKTINTILIAVLLFAGTAFPVDRRVPEDFVKIQSAIEAAQDGDRVLIADGAYRERLNFLGKAITVCGNIANPERVIIKPDTAGSIVVFKNGEGVNSVLCGVTLRGATTDYGGGAYIKNASPTLHHLVVDSCYASRRGGGIYIEGDCQPEMNNLTICNNRASYGGGFACSNGPMVSAQDIRIDKCTADTSGGGVDVGINSHLTISNLTVENCTARKGSGGGIYLLNNSHLNATNLQIIRSTSRYSGGGIYCYNSSTVTINHSIVKACRTSSYGGGYYLSRDSRATLASFTIDSCLSTSHGAAIYCAEQSSIDIRNGKITRNWAAYEGGGLHLTGKASVVERVLIVDNYAGDWGSAIYSSGHFPVGEPSHSFNHLTISKHSPRFMPDEEFWDCGHLIMLTQNAKLTNSIIWGNQSEVIIGGAGALIAYSCIVNTDSLIGPNLLVEEGVITVNPLFADYQNNDFTLQKNSPCINAGDPDSPKDPDSTRADMGAFPLLAFGMIKGAVVTKENQPKPVQGVKILCDNGRVTETDENGLYELSNLHIGEYSLKVSHDDFARIHREGLKIDNDTLELNIQLSAPVIELFDDTLSMDVETGKSTETQFFLRNTGIGDFEWTLSVSAPGGWMEIPWRHHHSIALPVEENFVPDGVTFVEGHYAISCRVNGEKLILILNEAGEEVRRFAQWGNGEGYMADLDTDGDRIIAVRDDKVYFFTVDNFGGGWFDCPGFTTGKICWDSDQACVRVTDGAPGSPIKQYDRIGNFFGSITSPDQAVTGMAFWLGNPNQHSIIFTHTNGNRTEIIQFDQIEEHALYGEELLPSLPGVTRGASIVTSLAPGNVTALLTTRTKQDSSFVDVWTVSNGISWLTLNPDIRQGVIGAGERQHFEIIVDATKLDTGLYTAELHFNHMMHSEPIVVPIIVTVVEELSVNNTNLPLPTEFAVTALYPNPFNARLNIGYALPQAGEVSVTLFDLNGREVHRQTAGAVSAGYHSFSLDCSHLPTGLYMVKVNAGGRSITKKALLLK